jgi:hypothetical protein
MLNEPGAAQRASARLGGQFMASMIVRHTVRDYREWRPVFDAHEGARQAAGLTNAKVYCSTDDPNDLLLMFEIADRQRAEAFGASEDLRSTMQSAGVVGKPEISYTA